MYISWNSNKCKLSCRFTSFYLKFTQRDRDRGLSTGGSFPRVLQHPIRAALCKHQEPRTQDQSWHWFLLWYVSSGAEWYPNWPTDTKYLLFIYYKKSGACISKTQTNHGSFSFTAMSKNSVYLIHSNRGHVYQCPIETEVSTLEQTNYKHTWGGTNQLTTGKTSCLSECYDCPSFPVSWWLL